MTSSSTQRPSVPRSITQMARAHRLGKRRAAYGYGNSSDISRNLVSTLVGYTLLCGGLLLLGISIHQNGVPDPGASIGTITLFILSAIFLAIAYAGRHRDSQKVGASWIAAVYPAGCIIQQNNQEAQIFRWDEIEAAWLAQGVVRLTGVEVIESYRIQRADGYEVTLTRAGGSLKRLTEVINAHLTERLISHVLAQYSSGQMVVFGPCGINQEGICLLEQDEKLLPWSRFVRDEVKQGNLLLYADGQTNPWASIPGGTIPNLALMLELIEVTSNEHAARA